MWFEKCEQSFQRLKKLLTSAPDLKIENPKNTFMVCTNDCIEGLGGVTMQEGFLIFHESKSLGEA